MTPAELAAVWASWSHLRRRRADVVLELARWYQAAGVPEAVRRAAWLSDAVEQLVDQLASPSRLADRARALAETWPDPTCPPTYAVDGRAWEAAARRVAPVWPVHTERAWQQGWYLLSEVLAAETLSPFGERGRR
jgi:hypothetical protein